MKIVGMTRGLLAASGFAALAFAAPAMAQDEPVPEAPPAQYTEAISLSDMPAEEQTMFTASLGVTGNGGNTKAFAGNFASRLLVQRTAHVLTVEGLAALGWADVADDDSDRAVQTSQNFVGRARYDYFLSKKDAVFVSVTPRRDTFALLNLRVQIQAGYARTLYQPTDTLKLWGEFGGDVTIDQYRRPATPRSNEIYSLRGFLGYMNHNNPAALVDVGIEALLPPYSETGANGNYRYRINASADVNSTLSTRFKLGASLRVLYDSSPIDDSLEKADFMGSLVLTYTYDSLAEAPAAPEAPPCPPCEEAAAEPAPEAAAAAATGEASALEAEAAVAEEAGARVQESVAAQTAEGEEAVQEAEAAAAEAKAPAEKAVDEAKAEPAPAGTGAASVAAPKP